MCLVSKKIEFCGGVVGVASRVKLFPTKEGDLKMSKRGGRRRKRGVVDPPRMDDLEYSPPESVKKARLIAKTDAPEPASTSFVDVTSSQQTSCLSSSQIAATASQMAACDKAPCLWSAEEVVKFVRKSGLPENVAEAFKGAIIY